MFSFPSSWQTMKDRKQAKDLATTCMTSLVRNCLDFERGPLRGNFTIITMAAGETDGKIAQKHIRFPFAGKIA